jgi:hypothetical protein
VAGAGREVKRKFVEIIESAYRESALANPADLSEPVSETDRSNSTRERLATALIAVVALGVGVSVGALMRHRRVVGSNSQTPRAGSRSESFAKRSLRRRG